MPTFLELESLNISLSPNDSDPSFRTIFEYLPVMCYVTEPEPPFAPIYVSSPTIEAFGYSLEEWRTNADLWINAIHEDDRVGIIEKSDVARFSNTEFNEQYRLVAADGTVRWIHDRGRFVRDPAGNLVCWIGIMMDITDGRKAQLQLLANEESYKSIFEDANDIIYVHDLKGNYLWMNRAAERILGYTPEESLKMHMSDIVAPEYFETAQKMLEKKLAGEIDKTAYEIECIAKDGRNVTLEVNTRVIHKDGTPFAVQGVARDVTDRRQAEQRLADIERRLQNVFQNTNDLVYNYDRNGKFTWISPSAERILGYTPEEAVSMSVLDVVAPDYLDVAKAAMSSKLDGDATSTELELDFIAKDGHRLTLEISSFPIYSGTARIGVQGIARDVTERRKAQRLLIQSEERYRRVFEDSSDIVYNLDLHGNFIWVSRSIERLLGYTVEEALKMNTRDLASDDQLQVVSDMIDVKASGKVERTEYEVECRAKDGTTVVLEISSSILYSGGKPIGIQGIGRDITHRRESEKRLRESELKFRTLAETASDAILTIDEHSNIIFGNAAAEVIFGYKEEELVGMSLVNLIPERFRADHIAGIARYNETGERALSWKAVQVPGLHKSGREIPLEFSFAQFENEGKSYFTGIIRDISERFAAEEALRASEEQYRELFENAHDIVQTHDLKGNILAINHTAERVLGYSQDEAKLININETIAPESREFAKSAVRRVRAGEDVGAYEIELLAKDGRRVPVEVSTRLIFKDSVAFGVTSNARDITERRLADDAMRESLSLLTSTLESTKDGVVVVNAEGRIVVHNRRFVELFGLPPHVVDQSNGFVAADFVKDQLVDPEEFMSNTERLYSDPLGTSVEILSFKDGRVYERYSQPQFLEGVAVGRVCSFQDVTARIRSEERLRHHALHDSLTNLPNRAQFMVHLRQAIDRNANNPDARFAVLFLDLDRFKVVNDSLGHVVGDDLLVAISEKLQSCIRPGDIVARLGGDEFSILLNRTGTADDVAHVAERIQAKLSEPFSIDNYEVFTTASVGIILSDEVRREPEDFLRDADAAMYRAKEAGKARYAIFDREMHVRNLNLLKIETDLRRAIERSEFRVLYQPIVRMDTGVIREFESLIRWNHPEFGLVAPSEFIGVAEETGLIVPIGRSVIEESCRQIAEWQTLVSFPLSVSVNLSAKQLMHPSLIPQVEEVLLKTSLSSRQLKLEVTETTVMENSERALAVLEELEDLGIALSTDDFGTGYSSLSYLHRFPFTRLKIDQSFTKRMDKDAKSLAIVKTILMLGRNLGIEVVAEGVETESQYELLRSLGCHLGQGYFFAAPAEPAVARELLTSRNRSFTTTGPGVQDFSDDPGFAKVN